MRILNLYKTLGCHLCEDAAAMVKKQQVADVTLNLVEIIDSENLIDQYGTRIPVIKFQKEAGIESAELGWPFTEEELAVFLNGS
jgi:hypothetical protein